MPGGSTCKRCRIPTLDSSVVRIAAEVRRAVKRALKMEQRTDGDDAVALLIEDMKNLEVSNCRSPAVTVEGSETAAGKRAQPVRIMILNAAPALRIGLSPQEVPQRSGTFILSKAYRNPTRPATDKGQRFGSR